MAGIHLFYTNHYKVPLLYGYLYQYQAYILTFTGTDLNFTSQTDTDTFGDIIIFIDYLYSIIFLCFI